MRSGLRRRQLLKQLLKSSSLLCASYSTTTATALSPKRIQVSSNQLAYLKTVLTAQKEPLEIVLKAGHYDLRDFPEITLKHNLSLLCEHGEAHLRGANTKIFMRTDETPVHLSLHNIAFNDWRNVIFLRSSPKSGFSLTIKNCTFSQSLRAINANASVFKRNTPQFDSIKITDSTFNGGDSENPIGEFGILIRQTYQYLMISKNEFRNFSIGAIVLSGASNSGGEIRSEALMRRNSIVSENYINNIIGKGTESHGILIAGSRAIVDKNIIEKIDTRKPTNTGCEGIYLKCHHGVISDNILHDAGKTEGAIIVKGVTQHDTGKDPYGYGNRITGNRINYSENYLKATDYKAAAITISCSDTSVTNNHIENAAWGIISGTRSTSNISIGHNQIYNARVGGIKLYIHGENYNIFKNWVEFKTPLYPKLSTIVGILVKFVKPINHTNKNPITIINVGITENRITDSVNSRDKYQGIMLLKDTDTRIRLEQANIISNNFKNLGIGINFNIKNSRNEFTTVNANAFKNRCTDCKKNHTGSPWGFSIL